MYCYAIYSVGSNFPQIPHPPPHQPSILTKMPSPTHPKTPISPSPPSLEIAIFGTSSLLPALGVGARRIELNAAGSYPSAGLTPTEDEVRDAVRHLASWYYDPTHAPGEEDVPLRVMIRPTARDFVYSASEVEEMRGDMRRFAPYLRQVRGGAGFVFGCLISDGLGVDEVVCTELVALARGLGLGCVFHRACDGILGERVRDTLEGIGRCGFEGVLTAGGVGDVVDRVGELEGVVDIARELGLEVIVGGGVRSRNIGRLIEGLGRGEGRLWFHSSCLRGGGSERVDLMEVRALRRALDEWFLANR